MKHTKYDALAENIIKTVGNQRNIQLCTHCATRIRFNLKDYSEVNLEILNSIDGVIGSQFVGDQLQIIIGPDVDQVYEIICEKINLKPTKRIEDKSNNKNIKNRKIGEILGDLVTTVSSTIEPMFIIFTLGGFFRLFSVLLGPSLLGWLSEDSHLLILFNLVGDTCFAYFPIFIAYTSAKKFDANIPMALLLACILINPTLAELMETYSPFTVYGLPVVETSYLNSFLPTLLITFTLSKVENIFKDLFPKSLKTILFPMATMLVMLPLSLVFLGPIGNIIGTGLANSILWLQNIFGPLATAIVGALFPLLIVTGMHHALNSAAMVEYVKKGYDSCIWAGSYIMDFQLLALCFASLIKSKEKENKAIAMSCIATEGIGGISEPTIFGIMLKSRKNILYVMAGGFFGGFYIGLMNVNVYVFAPSGFLSVFAYSGGSTANFVNGIIACIIAFVIPFTLALLFGLGIED